LAGLELVFSMNLLHHELEKDGVSVPMEVLQLKVMAFPFRVRVQLASWRFIFSYFLWSRDVISAI
jgi:hypothetical protein